MVTIRLKLIVSFLFVSLTTAGTVGASAWWLFKQDFNDSLRLNAFANFSKDIKAYIMRYGSWDAAQRAQPFPEFVAQQPPRLPPPPDGKFGTFIHRGQPPFHFLLLTPDGKAVQSVGDYHEGQQVPENILRQSKPIEVNGQTVLYALPQGDPILSLQDQAYLNYMHRALLIGIAIAAAVAILLGIIFGTELVRSLRELTLAMKSMRPDGEVPQAVAVRSRDEVGLLAESFNRMSRLLGDAHRDLLKSHATISDQAEKLRDLSIRDHLTSIHNRRYFDDHAQVLLRRSIRHKHPMCIMLADLDHFKMVNDNFSHATGDEVLRQTTVILRENIRESDLLARYGGEEFIALFVESTFAQARQRCEILRQRIEQYDWQSISPGLKVTISVGLCDDLSLGSIEAMLQEADKNLYLAKERGRNRVEPTY